MKLSCTKENLLKGLSIVSHIASKNITLPILNNVLLRAENGTLEISATNLEIGVIARVRGKVETDGAFTVNAKLLTDYISLLANDRIDIELQDQSLHIHCANSNTVIRGMEATEFPVMPVVEKKHEFTLSAKELRAGLSQVVFAVSNDESRPEISGVYVQVKGKSLTLVATDSYRLAERTLPLESGSADTAIIIPAKTVHELLRIISDEDETITMVQSETQVQFSLPAVQLVSRTIEGRYPDYTQIIPQSHTTKAQAPVEEFAKAIRTASLFCKAGVNDVTLHFITEKKAITVSALNAQVGEHTTTLAARIDGKDNDAVFNYRYVLDGLANIGTGEVEIALEDSDSPGILRPQGRTDYLYIIMPIKQ